MQNSNTDSTVTLELYVRSLACRGGQDLQDSVIERLDQLAANGTIDDYTIELWGDRIPTGGAIAETETCQQLQERIEAFLDWAERTGVEFRGCFDTEQVYSEFTDERYQAIELPQRALAEYHDGTLTWVAPCVDQDTVYTVSDRLNMLAASGPITFEEATTGTPHTSMND